MLGSWREPGHRLLRHGERKLCKQIETGRFTHGGSRPTLRVAKQVAVTVALGDGMKAVLQWLLLAVTCLSLTAEAVEVKGGLPELAMRDAIMREASEIYARGDLGVLAARSDAYVQSRERTSSGLWVSGLFATGVANAIVDPKPTDSAGWDALERRVEDWATASPRSPLAHLMVAEIISRRAWSIRGGGFAHTVAPEAWAPFRGHLARARKYLVSKEKIASGHPEYYTTLVGLDTALNLGDTQVRKDFDAGVRRYPNYYPLYFSMLNHLMPKWHGGPGEIEAFTRAAVDATRALEGEGMYARIYWYAAQDGYDDTLFFASFARWDRMRAGFEDVIARYPDQWNLQNYAHFACQAGDAETVARLLPRLQSPISQAWQGRPSFAECRRLAGQLST